jgi:hypothetical protein
MKLNLKYNALKVDEIEKEKGIAIENCITDTTISNIILFVQKGLGLSREEALQKIDEYLVESDKQELVLDIMEALIAGGFLPKSLDIASLRGTMKADSKKGKALGKSGKN